MAQVSLSNMRNNMTTKLKFSNLFLTGLVILSSFLVLNFSPNIAQAQEGGICTAAYSGADIFCFAGCEQQTSPAECSAYGGSQTNAGSNLVASPGLAQGCAEDGCSPCECVWQSDGDPENPPGGGGTCFDGIQNQDETGVDTGGVCTPAECAITTPFSADSSPLPYNNSGTTLRFGLNETNSWNISVISGSNPSDSGLSPASGNTSSGIIQTGSLTSSKVYRLSCSAPQQQTPVTQDVAVVVQPPPGTPEEDTCQDPTADNYGSLLPCNYPSYCSDPAANNYNGALPCTYDSGVCTDLSAANYNEPLPCVYTPLLTPSISGPSCVPIGQSSYNVTLTWPAQDNDVLIFIDDNLSSPEGFNKSLYGTPGTTGAPAGFTQRIPGGPQVLVLEPNKTYYTFMQNSSADDGDIVSWSVPQCAPPSTPPGGNVDAGLCDVFAGWAWDPDYPNTPTSVQFYKNGAFYSSASASIYRSDLAGAGYGNGNHGFNITTPEDWKTGTNQSISVYAVDLNGTSTPQLSNSPKIINCVSDNADISIQALGCQIPAGASTCTGSVSWGIINPISNSPTTLTKSNPVVTTSVSTSGSNPISLNRGDTLFTIAHAGLSAEALVNAACAPDSSWNGTICAATPPSFDYTLSNSGSSSVIKGNSDAYTTNTITKNLVSGTGGSVTLSLSGVPSGVSYSLSNGTCAPGCSSVITFTVSPSAPVGTHPIVVTGSPFSKTTTFNLVISGSPLPVSCSASASTVFVGQPVTWTGSVSGGTSPYTYSWSGTNLSAPLPNTNPFTKTYTTIGQKTAQLTVTDAVGTQGICQAATIQVNFDPEFEEF